MDCKIFSVCVCVSLSNLLQLLVIPMIILENESSAQRG